jgi:myo-inositol-1(or 4)-monophosphatase
VAGAPDPSELLDLALRTARAAGTLLLERAHAPERGIQHKSSATDPATDADRDAEALIRAALHEARPNDAILGEEGGQAAGTDGSLRWVVDPLDGTVNFLYGFPAWCVSIACRDEAGTLLGVVHDPNRDETFAALRGRGATLDGEPIRVRGDAELARALVGTGFAYVAERRVVQAALLERVLPNVRDVRRAGSAALDLCWVAAGRLDAFYEHGLNDWDLAAGELIVVEAGGAVAELEPRDGLPGGVVAAPPGILEPLRALIGG